MNRRHFDPRFARQQGSVSILVIAYVLMAMLLTYGILAVAESLIAKNQVQYAAQTSANAGATVYGQTYIKEMNSCIKEKIQEILDETSSTVAEQDAQTEAQPTAGSTVEACTPTQLQACIDSDFRACDVDLNTCFEEDESPIQACLDDNSVRQAAIDAAHSEAQGLANRNQLEQFQFSFENDVVHISAQKYVASLVPQFGKSTTYHAIASSKVIIKESQEQQ